VNGDPDIAVRTPLVGLMVNADRVESMLFPTKRNLPDESTVGAIGFRPAVKGDPGTAVSAPEEPIVNAITSVESPIKELEIPTKRNLLEGSIANARGEKSAGKGLPGTGVNLPALESMLNAEIVELELLARKTNFPAGATATGASPEANGEPEIGLMAPVAASITKPETLFEPWFAVYRYFPEGSLAIITGFPAAGKGEPAIVVSAPLVASIAYAEIVLSEKFVT
jgi:hypothetical protein